MSDSGGQKNGLGSLGGKEGRNKGKFSAIRTVAMGYGLLMVVWGMGGRRRVLKTNRVNGTSRRQLKARYGPARWSVFKA